jgi:hypothetical protein
MIEADDEAAVDVHSLSVDPPHGRQHVLTDILELQCLLQALLVGGLDADEHPFEVRLAEELEKGIILSDVQ